MLDPVAVHEAGHAVCAERIGCPVQSITRVPSGHYSGHVTYGEGPPLPPGLSDIAKIRLRSRTVALVTPWSQFPRS